MTPGDDGVIPDTTSPDSGEEPAVRAVPPALETSQQPGFKVVNEAPKRGGSKLVWTALVVIIAILAAYVLGYFR